MPLFSKFYIYLFIFINLLKVRKTAKVRNQYNYEDKKCVKSESFEFSVGPDQLALDEISCLQDKSLYNVNKF